MSTLGLVRQGLNYVDWLSIIRSSELVSIIWIFSPGHAGMVSNEMANVLSGAEVDVRSALDPQTVPEILSATKVEDMSYNLSCLKEKNVDQGDADGCNGKLYGPAKWRANQLKMETICILHFKMDAAAERGVCMDRI